ncbi:MAG: hypothetical protein IT236_00080 [Bacteroidia bacterium]|nr:hypothetical protein [Bacteroidia bacterium]
MTMNTFEKHLKEKMSGLETLPEQDSFNAVLQKMQVHKRKKRLLFFYSVSGVAAILVAVMFGFYNANSPEQLLVTKDTPAPASIVKKVPQATTTESIASNKKPTLENPLVKNDDDNLNQSGTTPTPVQIKAQGSSGKNNLLIASTNSDETSTSSTNIASSPVILSNTTKPINTKSSENSTSNSGSVHSDNTDFVSSPKTTLNTDSLIYLDLHPMGLFQPQDNSINLIDNSATEKKIYRLKSKTLTPKFFVDISYLLLAHTYQFEGNTTANVHPTGYTSNFNSYYLQNRKDQNRYYAQNAPGIKFGATLRNKLELSVQTGYRNFIYNETINVPVVDTSQTSGNLPGTVTTAYVPGNPIYATSLPTTPNELDGMKVKNRLNYFNVGFNFATILRLRHFQLKPGLNASLNRLISANYVLLDANGYELQHKSTRFLNRNLYTFAFKVGLCKRLSQHFSFQATPLYQISANTLFDGGYFIKQKVNGFGIESSVIYHF